MYTQENDTKRFALYQAGKCLVQTLLPHHPKMSNFRITESLDNVFSFSAGFFPIKPSGSSSNNAKLSFSLSTTIDLETLLIGFSAGRAGEFFNCYTSKEKFIRRTPLFDYRKTKLTKRQRPNVVRLTDKYSYKQNRGLQKTKRKKSEAESKLRFSYVWPLLFSRGVTKPVTQGVTQAELLFGAEFRLLKQTLGSSRQKLVALHKHQLPREQCYSLFVPLHNCKLINRLNCTKINHLLCQSDMGSLERTKATFLVQFLLINQSIYSPDFINLQKNCGVGNLNKIEISDIKSFDIFNSFKEQINNVFLKEIRKCSSILRDKSLSNINVYSKSFDKKKEFVTNKIDLLSQKKEISARCEEQVCKTLMFSKKSYGHWFRIYLPQIQTHQRQPISQDQFFKIRTELELSIYSIGDINYTLNQSGAEIEQKWSKALVKRFGYVPNTTGKWSKALVLNTRANKADTTGKWSKALVLNTSGACVLPGANQNEVLVHAGNTSGACVLPGAAGGPGKKRANKSLNKSEAFVSPFVQAFVRPGAKQKQSTLGRIKAKHSFGREAYFGARLLPQEFGYGMCHHLLVKTFSQALNIIGKNRELLDILTDHLIRFGKMRVPEIVRICLLYADSESLI